MNSKQSELRRLMKLEREKVNNTYTNTNTTDTITKDNSKIQRAIVSTKKVKGILKSTSSFSNNQQQESSSITTATKSSQIGNYSSVNADSKAKVDFIAEEEDDHQIQQPSNQPQNDGNGNSNVDTNGNSKVDAETGNNEDDDQMKEFEDFLNSVDDDVNDDNNNSINNDDDQKDGIQYEKTNEKLHNEELTATKIASEITTESNNKVEDEMGAVNDIGNKNISNNISNSEISTHTDNTTNAIIDEVEFEQTTYEARLAKLMLLSRKRKLVGKNNDIDKNIIKGRYEYSYDEATDDNNDNDNKMIANGNENENSNDIVHTSKNTTTFKKSSIKDLLRKKLSKKSRLMKNNNQLYNDDDDDDF